MQRSVEHLEGIALKALMEGYGTLSTWSDMGTIRRQMTINVSMDCESPVCVELHSRWSSTHGKTVRPFTIIVNSRCRKCAPCRERKRMFWAARAIDEFQRSPLTLFGTLTFRPEVDANVDAEARIELAERGVSFDSDLNDVEKFRVRTQYAGRYVTRWLKRVRAGSASHGKPAFRYLFVAEAHESGRTSDLKHGRPHFHCLLHMENGAAPLIHPHEWARRADGAMVTDKYGNPRAANDSFLKTQWTEGHSSFFLCQSQLAAAYVCKYLTKAETTARVRASFRYGRLDHENRCESNAPSPEVGIGGLDRPALEGENPS